MAQLCATSANSGDVSRRHFSGQVVRFLPWTECLPRVSRFSLIHLVLSPRPLECEKLHLTQSLPARHRGQVFLDIPLHSGIRNTDIAPMDKPWRAKIPI